MNNNKKGPIKTTINLAQTDRKWQKEVGAGLLVLVFAVFVLALYKVGVKDSVEAVSLLENQRSEQELILAQLEENNREYQQVFSRYQIELQSCPGFAGGIDSMKSLDLMEQELLKTAKVSSFTIGSPDISVQFSGVTLHNISNMHQSLMTRDMVSGVWVYTAGSDEEQSPNVTAYMTIKMKEKKQAETDAKEEETP